MQQYDRFKVYPMSNYVEKIIAYVEMDAAYAEMVVVHTIGNNCAKC